MRIAVWHNLPSGGGKRALYDHVRGLVARGHEVEAWCPPTADRSYLPLRAVVPEHVVPLKLSSYLRSSSGLSRKLHPFRWNPWIKLWAMDSHSLECARQIHAKGFDLLFAACCMFFQTPLIGRFVDMPSVVYLQEPMRYFYESLPELPWLALSWKFKDLFQTQFWRRALVHRGKLLGIRVLGREERRNALAFNEILVNSLYSRESVLRSFGVNSKVCYLGVDTAKFVNQNKPRESFVVFVGALIPWKNVEFLIESVGRVAVPLRPRVLLVANTINPSYFDRIRKQAAEAGVNFELKHQIDDSELVDILNRARVMIYAPRLEPFGYAPLEANACGLPVIAVAEGGVRETVQDGVNGILVEHDAELMAAAIERVMVDDELHGRLSKQAERLARTTWSFSSAIDKLEFRLNAALQNAGRKPLPLTVAARDISSGAVFSKR